MTVVLVGSRQRLLVPMEAIELLCGDVEYTEEMPVAVAMLLPSARLVQSEGNAPLLLSSDPTHPAVTARMTAGERLISAANPQCGERLLDAVALMDQLRTTGQWEAQQTHDSLRRYLLEETYELLDAVGSGDSGKLREELGDLLLLVLFHARIAEDAPRHPFTIDDVADTLLRKLGRRRLAALAQESLSHDEQVALWEKAKASEKARSSVLDDVVHNQPALALAQKVIERTARAGLPTELVPATITTVAVSADVDAENTLRAAVLKFIDAVRSAEQAIKAGRGASGMQEADAPLGVITEQEWRTCWPVYPGSPGKPAQSD